MKNTCKTCKNFESFRDSYFDELEPENQGFCNDHNSPLFGNEGANWGASCNEYKEKENDTKNR